MPTPNSSLPGPCDLRDDATLADERDASEATADRALVGHALLVGVAGDALLRDFGGGVSFPLWISILALAMTSVVWRSGRQVPREASAWLITAFVFSCGLAWRDSETLGVGDFLATLGALGMAAVALSDSSSALFAARLRDTAWAAAAVVRSTAAGIVPLALREFFAPESRGRWARRGRPALRAVVIAAALLFVFGSLLRSADPIFASLVSLPEIDVDAIVRHIIGIGFFTWIVGGWCRAALADRTDARRAPDSLPFTLGSLDVTTALATLNVLFGAFVATQLGWFFGGERFLRERTGLTAAAYAREGFFQMVWVVVLVVPVLLATRAALRPGRDLARRHTALSLPVIGLLGAIILSAMLRMRLYVHYYGLTTDRFYPLVLMGWLAFVLVWLALTVLRDQGRLFLAGTVLSGMVTLAALNAAAPDAIVARVNLARAARGADLDLTHLARLSGEAASLATAAVLAPSPTVVDSARRATTNLQRCTAASVLLDRWGRSAWSAPRRPGGERNAAWRYWNAGEARAVRVVGEHARALHAVQRATCKYVNGLPTRLP
jgi:hypothetical protein